MSYRTLFSFIIFIIVGWGLTAQAVEPPQTVKAIYGFSSNQAPFDAIPKARLAEWLKDHGINAVFASPSEDEAVLRLLREEEIPVYEEITIFASRTLYREHPEWRPIGMNGEALEPDGWYHGLSPNKPELRQKRLDDFRKRLQNPELDGIWLDFIRYPVRWEGKNPLIEQSDFSDIALEQFEEFAGVDLPMQFERSKIAERIVEHYPKEWQEFKIHTITSWVQEAKQIRDELRPDVKLGLFGVPWLEEDYDNAIKRIVAQDFTRLANYVDIFSPMVYHKLTHHNVEWIARVTNAFQSQTQKPVWPIVQAVSEPTHLSSEEFRRSLKIGLKSSKAGVIVFTAKHVENENRWDDIKQVFTTEMISND